MSPASESHDKLTIAQSVAFVYVDSLAGDVIELDDDVAHHLHRVRRIGANESVVVADGAGSWRIGLLEDHAVVPATDHSFQAPTASQLTVGFAPTKGDRPELVIQKLTELGVDRILLVETERSVVRWNADRQAKAQRRFSRVIQSAGEQSRRLYLPTLEFATLSDVIADGASVADMGGVALDASHRVVVVGPEGGWSNPERALFTQHDATRVGVAPGVLRAETAAIAVGAAMVRERGIGIGPFDTQY